MVKRALVVLFALAACKQSEPKAPQVDVAALKDPNNCRPCHAAVVDEWQASLHAGAHEDPIFVGVRTLRSKKEQDLETKCAVCHAPVAATSGVTCFACHATAEVHADRGRGKKALTWSSDGRLYGPSDLPAKKTPVHGTGAAPAHLKDGATLCLACHGDLANADGVPLCQTATEWEAAKSGKSCVDCHMPPAKGPASVATAKTEHTSHRFAGPRGLWTTEGAIAERKLVSVSGAIVDGQLEVRVENRTGHAFPSGFPGRMAKVVATSGDYAQEVLLAKRHEDADGKPTIAAYAKKITADTRLLPNETRVVKWPAPEGDAPIEVKVVLRLLPPPLAEKIGVDGPLAAPRVVAKTTVTR
jgi:hypothetical protein